MKVKGTLTILIIMAICCLTACRGNIEQPEDTIKTNIKYNKESINQSVINVVSTGEIDSNFVDSFVFNAQDITDINSSSRAYYFDGAYYMQTGEYMYRFQLNENSLIETYIRYNIIN